MKEERNIHLREFCEVTTFGGIIDWYIADHRIGNFFWLFTIIILLSVTLWQTTDGTSSYFVGNYYRSSVSIEPQIGVRFPNVTICNFNRAMKSKTANIRSEALSYAFASFPIIYDLPLTMFNITKYETAWKEFSQKNPDLSDLTVLMKTIGSTCKSTFINCMWSGNVFDCCQQVTPVVNGYGNCFMISPPNLIGEDYPMQTVSGASQGLKLIMFPHLEEYPNDLYVSNLLESGFIISVNYIYEPHIPEPLTVGIGTHAWIALNPMLQTVTKPQITVHPLPCRKDPELNLLNVHYSKSNCYFDCRMQVALKYCKCVPYAPFLEPQPICNGSVISYCMNLILSQESKNELKHCQTICQISCEDTMTLTSRVSMTKYPSNKSKEAMVNIIRNAGIANLSVEDVGTISSVDIYFPRLEIATVETYETMSVVTFISNIGGNLGLWLGISLTTAIQTMYQIIEWLVFRCQNSKIKPIINRNH